MPSRTILVRGAGVSNSRGRSSQSHVCSLNLSVRRATCFYALYLLEVVSAAIVALVAQDLVAVVIDAMILNVLVLVIPLTFLVRLSGDRALLGPLAASRRYSAMLWLMTAGLLALGLTSVVGVIGRAI